MGRDDDDEEEEEEDDEDDYEHCFISPGPDQRHQTKSQLMTQGALGLQDQ